MPATIDKPRRRPRHLRAAARRKRSHRPGGLAASIACGLLAGSVGLGALWACGLFDSSAPEAAVAAEKPTARTTPKTAQKPAAATRPPHPMARKLQRLERTVSEALAARDIPRARRAVGDFRFSLIGNDDDRWRNGAYALDQKIDAQLSRLVAEKDKLLRELLASGKVREAEALVARLSKLDSSDDFLDALDRMRETLKRNRSGDARVSAAGGIMIPEAKEGR